ncbi:MAG: PEP-utilizing enzyme [Myxococcota bacterium]
MSNTDRFSSPFDIKTPPGGDGWEGLYSSHLLFSDDRREYEESQFWFRDSIHWPRIITPFDATFTEFALYSLSQYNSRHYLVPPALGVDFRILNGYCFLTPVGIADPAEIESRVPHFMERAGFYYQNWNDLYDKWMVKAKDVVARLEAIEFPLLPDMVDLEVVTSGEGKSHLYDHTRAYHNLIDLGLELWQYHFEFLNLGYAAYLDYFGFCKQVFPDIPDLSIAKMVAGIEVDLFRPDMELRKLARRAVELEVTDALNHGASYSDAVAALQRSSNGQTWLSELEEVKHPWFNYSNGSGFHHNDAVWADKMEIPLGFINGYIGRIQAGENIERPTDEIIAERDRVTAEYTELLDGDDRANFEQKVGLARLVFHYVENHNFYVEHWGHSVFWRKMRELGSVFVQQGFWSNPDDIFYLRRNEIPEALMDMMGAWAVGTEPRGKYTYPKEVARRREILEALGKSSPPPALGVPPEVVTEPFTIMLWGVTSDSIQTWLGGLSSDGGLNGFAASPGVAEGVARVITDSNDIGTVKDGEILVASLTAPSWAPIFRRIAGTVTDTGGMMSHAAIVCREYGLPAVTGTAFATQQIETGMRVRVDGNTGEVSIISE